MYSTKISSDITVDKKSGKSSGNLNVRVNGYSKEFSGDIKVYKDKPEKKAHTEKDYWPKGACSDTYREMISNMLGWRKKLKSLSYRHI